jgi:bifunctional DNA-binding transcriptional regulator/antitoxin component of YhaV-PrlF toxin-antitoxin module
MPQLVKGGKHVFGWSRVGNQGTIMIPSEAFAEYRLTSGEKVFLISGSRTSGGFGLIRRESLKMSRLAVLLEKHPELSTFRIPEGRAVESGGKVSCWVRIQKQRITVPVGTLALFGIKPGARVLSVRGSGWALGFIARGPILEEAGRHPELETV